MVREVEYRGLVAEAWDALRGDTSTWPDRAFYLEMIAQSGEPVLDVGCGTGRLLLDYLSLGIDIEGVDNAPDMVAICRARAERAGLQPVIHEQHLEALDLLRRYRTILIPSSTIQLVVEPEQARLAMERIRGHLTPDGIAVASFMPLWREGYPLEGERESRAAAEAPDAEYRRVARSRYDPQSECEDTEDLYQLLVAGTVVREERFVRQRATRSYMPGQAAALFAAAGFADVTVRHAFTFEPAHEGTRMCTVSGRNPD